MPALIAVDGIDGCGKTTIVNGLGSVPGTQIRITREPFAKSWREMRCTDDWLIDRRQHIDYIRAQMERGFDVVTDRYASSTYAYQGLSWVESCCGLTPDVLLIVDTPIDVCEARVVERGEIFDRDAMERISERFDQLANRYDFVSYVSDLSEAISVLRKSGVQI